MCVKRTQIEFKANMPPTPSFQASRLHLKKCIEEYEALLDEATKDCTNEFRKENENLRLDRTQGLALINEFKKQFAIKNESSDTNSESEDDFQEFGLTNIDVASEFSHLYGCDISEIDEEFDHQKKILALKKRRTLSGIRCRAMLVASEQEKRNVAEFLENVNKARNQEVQKANFCTYNEFLRATLEFALTQKTLEEERVYYEKENNIKYPCQFNPPELMIEFQLNDTEKEAMLLKLPWLEKRISVLEDGLENYGMRCILELTFKDYERLKDELLEKDTRFQKFIITPENVFLLKLKSGNRQIDHRLEKILTERMSKDQCVLLYGISSGAMVILGIGLMCTPGGQVCSGIILGAGMAAGGNVLKQHQR